MLLIDAINARRSATLCVSLSSNPGTFGITVHNAGYLALGLNFKYVACFSDNIGRDIALLKQHGVRGCSISMPFKQTVIQHLDYVDVTARVTKAVNTIVNVDGYLMGFNTDVSGFAQQINYGQLANNEEIKVYGAGGAARAVLFALREFENVSICTRNEVAGKLLAADFNRPYLNMSDYGVDVGTIINCTPVGMKNETFDFVDLANVQKWIDLVVTETPTVKAAKALGIPAYSGKIMALGQAAAQFYLYTGFPAPFSVMRDSLNA